jgi:transposase-like protein
MGKTPAAPKTLQDAIRYFTDPDTCLAFMVEIRWPDGVECPACASRNVQFIPTRRLWECKTRHPKRQFSAKVGTIFEDSPLGLDKWFAAIWLIANAKNGISSYELHRALGVTQKTAWFMLHRVREAMKSGTFMKMSGRVEADETLIVSGHSIIPTCGHRNLPTSPHHGEEECDARGKRTPPEVLPPRGLEP